MERTWDGAIAKLLNPPNLEINSRRNSTPTRRSCTTTGHRLSGGPVAERREISNSDVTTMEAGAGHAPAIFARLVVFIHLGLSACSTLNKGDLLNISCRWANQFRTASIECGQNLLPEKGWNSPEVRTQEVSIGARLL
jgi:hypothetical protein